MIPRFPPNSHIYPPMAALGALQHLHYSISSPVPVAGNPMKCRGTATLSCGNCRSRPKLLLRAMSNSGNGGDDGFSKTAPDEAVMVNYNPQRNVVTTTRLEASKNPVFKLKLQEAIASVPPAIFSMKAKFNAGFTAGLCAAAALLLFVIRSYAARKSSYSQPPGSVSDLVRRGQLKHDRRGISTPLKYDDPFNNPMVKMGNGNSTVEMCGKVYRLAPVTLTGNQQTIHQKRRSRAYQWKRPKVFLKEGDAVPPVVDPDSVRWIPANHPFATTTSDIDEGMAQNNVYQKHGVPFRIRAEHEALQKKLEALQNDQKLDKLVIDGGAAKDFERPFKPQLRYEDETEKSPSNGQTGSNQSNAATVQNVSMKSPAASEEMQNP